MPETPDISAALGLFDALSAYIEKHTGRLCPACEKVCCIDRHGSYEKEDLIFLSALGIEPAGEGKKPVDTEPCRFLTPLGCRLPRRRRPFRCTWYFCSPLLEAMKGDRPKEYRDFVTRLQKLVSLRGGLVGAQKNVI